MNTKVSRTAGKIDHSLATQAWGPEFDPQHPHKSQA